MKKVTFKNKKGFTDKIHGDVTEQENYLILHPLHSDNKIPIIIPRERLIEIGEPEKS